MKKMHRNIGIGAAAVVVILLALPLFINVNSFQPKIESELSNALGRKVEVGDLSLSIFGGRVSAANIRIADDPAFSTSPFLTAKSLKIGVELMPLIFSKQLNITGLTLDEPSIMLLSGPNGKWNFSSLAATSTETAPTSGGAPSGSLSVEELRVTEGKLLGGSFQAASLSIPRPVGRCCGARARLRTFARADPRIGMSNSGAQSKSSGDMAIIDPASVTLTTSDKAERISVGSGPPKFISSWRGLR